MKPAGTTLIYGDATHIPLADESVDLIFGSPPYFSLRDYQDEGNTFENQLGAEPTPQDFLEALWTVTKELWRVLKKDGNCIINLGDKRSGSGGSNNAGISKGPTKSHVKNYNKNLEVNGHKMQKKCRMLLPHRYAIGCEDGLADPNGIGWVIRSDNVWLKPSTIPDTAKDRTRDVHEYLFHMTKQGSYYSATDAIRERPTFGFKTNPIPGSVWKIGPENFVAPKELDVDHHATFPTELALRIILGWSPPGICLECGNGRKLVTEKQKVTIGKIKYDKINIIGHECSCSPVENGQPKKELPPTRPAIVLDPFVGTGTTTLVARTVGRYGIGIDLSYDYLRLAKWRTWDDQQERKVVSKWEAQLQETMF